MKFKAKRLRNFKNLLLKSKFAAVLSLRLRSACSKKIAWRTLVGLKSEEWLSDNRYLGLSLQRLFVTLKGWWPTCCLLCSSVRLLCDSALWNKPYEQSVSAVLPELCRARHLKMMQSFFKVILDTTLDSHIRVDSSQQAKKRLKNLKETTTISFS